MRIGDQKSWFRRCLIVFVKVPLDVLVERDELVCAAFIPLRNIPAAQRAYINSANDLPRKLVIVVTHRAGSGADQVPIDDKTVVGGVPVRAGVKDGAKVGLVQ